MQTLAAWVTRFPKQVLMLWALVAALAAPLAAQAPGRLSGDVGELQAAESTEVTRLLREEFGQTALNPVLVVVRPPAGAAGASHAAQASKAAEDYQAELAALPGVQRVTAVPLPAQTQAAAQAQAAAPAQAQAQADSASRLLVADIPLYGEASRVLAGIREHAAQVTASGALQVGVTGGQAIADDFTHYAEADTKRSELVALPLIAAVLLFVFGALVASGLPLLVGGLSISLSLAGLYLLAGVMDVATFAQSMVTMLGLGAGIDYALLTVSRFREELLARRPPPQDAEPKPEPGPTPAAQAAYATTLTAGRSVLWSGLTVAVAMAGLLIPPIPFIQSIGLAGVLTVLLTVLAAITALPAALTLLGERVNSPRRWARHSGRLAQQSPGWTAWARRVMRAPGRWAALGLSVLLLLMTPLRGLELGYGGAWGLAPGIASRDALEDLREMGAGGLLSQFEVVLTLDRPYDPARDAEAFRQVVDGARNLPGVAGVVSPFLTPAELQAGTGAAGLDGLAAAAALNERSFSASGRYLHFTVIPSHYLRADEIDPLAQRLRAQAAGTPFGVRLGGAPIGEREFSHAVSSAFPVVVFSVFAATFVLLLLAFRSLVVPLKSIVLNGLTVTAAIGAVAYASGGSALGSALGFFGGGGPVLDVMLPIMLFTVMFGLSMDYEIFLISRIHEGVQRGLSSDEAVAQAVGRTARIITSAAAIMFVVFAAFIAGRVLLTKSIGLGLAVAVLLDATLVRLLLVPAFMRLAGRWNWWLPPWLDRWLPRVNIEH